MNETILQKNVSWRSKTCRSNSQFQTVRKGMYSKLRKADSGLTLLLVAAKITDQVTRHVSSQDQGDSVKDSVLRNSMETACFFYFGRFLILILNTIV